MDKTSLGNRMKQYEAASKNYLMRRNPVIIRLDGKAFHTFTKGFDKPFDDLIELAMESATMELCKQIQGCVFGYTQSDEISLVLCDYKNVDTDAWYENNVQKMVSVSASMATFYFTHKLSELCHKLWLSNDAGFSDKLEMIDNKLNKGVFFDSRCFSLPKEEVVNYLIWRQQDATRNSIQALAQSLFSHKELQGLSCNELQDKIFIEKDINWNDLSTYQKRGAACRKIPFVNKKIWSIDLAMPILTQNRDYVNKFVFMEEDE